MKRIVAICLIFVALATLIVSCGSRAMNTAKLAYTKGEYDKALESLNQELSLNPKNGEAWNMLIDIYVKKGDTFAAAKAAIKAQQNIDDPKYIKDPPAKLYAMWLEIYNAGVNHLNKYMQNQDEKQLDLALKNFNMGTEIRPEILQFYTLKQNVYDLKKDKEGLAKANADYLEQINKFADFAKKTGIHFEMKMDVAKAKLGKALETQKIPLGKDSLIAESYLIDNKEVSVFYQDTKKNGAPVVIGWKPEIPKSWDPREKFQYLDIEINPLGNLAQVAYERKDYTEALNYLKLFQIFDPNNTNNSAAIFKLYQESGKVEDAKKAIEELIKVDPNNAMAWTQLGDLYSTVKLDNSTPTAEIIKNYNEAIKNYEKALSIDANYSFALRNIASVYKNKAVIFQKEESKKLETNPKYQENVEAYFPFLRKSAEYFERTGKSSEFSSDFNIYGELANIYLVVDDKAKFEAALKTLEGFKATVNGLEKQQKEKYLLYLYKIYGDIKNTDKLNSVEAELKNL